MPDQPSADEEGLNGMALLAWPSFTMTMMKNPKTTRSEMPARINCARVEMRIPKYSTANNPTMRSSVQAQGGRGFTENSEARVLWMYPPASK